MIPIAGAEQSVATIEWLYPGEAQYYIHPIISDFTLDEGLETLVCAGDNRTVALLDQAGKPLWTYNMFDWRLTATPAVGDIDNDKEMEVVIGGTDQTLTCLGCDGAVEWKRRLEGKIGWTSVVIADLENKGELTVITGTSQGEILAFDGKGNQRWKTKLQGGIGKPLAVGDIDADGDMEICVLCDQHWYLLDHKGETVWEKTGGAKAGGNPLLADLEGDGSVEILFATTDGRMICLAAATGDPLWMFAAVQGHQFGNISPALGDVDGDSKTDVVFVDYSGTVFVLDAAGNEIDSWRAPEKATGAPAIGDVDGDGKLEILIASFDGVFRCYSTTGRLKWHYPTKRRLQIPPSLGDIDNDGIVEIVLATGDGDVICFSCNGKYNPELMPWPCRFFDSRQSGWLR